MGAHEDASLAERGVAGVLNGRRRSGVRRVETPFVGLTDIDALERRERSFFEEGFPDDQAPRLREGPAMGEVEVDLLRGKGPDALASTTMFGWP